MVSQSLLQIARLKFKKKMLDKELTNSQPTVGMSLSVTNKFKASNETSNKTTETKTYHVFYIKHVTVIMCTCY